MALKPDLSQQAILITGAARGLGRSMALKLAGCGAHIAALDVDGAGCRETVAQIVASGGKASAFEADVSSRASFLEAAAGFARVAGRIDAVVNNAMLLKYEPVESVTEETLNRMTGI